MKSTYQSVLGPIDRVRLGHCQPHEHLFVEATPASMYYPELRMDEFEKSLLELHRYRRAGGSSVVDAQPVGAGRNAQRLADLSTASDVAIIASTGFHLPMFYRQDHWSQHAPEDLITDLFSKELAEGMYSDGGVNWPCIQTKIRAGVVKAAIGKDGLSGRTIPLLRAAGCAAARQGAPLLLHTERGLGALEAIDLLESCGLEPERVLVCHADRRLEDPKSHIAIAARGAYLEYDTIGRPKYHDDVSETQLIQLMIEAGHVDRILLSLDTTALRFRSYGGAIGLDYLLDEFLPLLIALGISPSQCHQITCMNPARALWSHDLLAATRSDDP